MPTSVALPPLVPPAQPNQNVHQPIHNDYQPVQNVHQTVQNVQPVQNVQDLTRQVSNVTINTPSPPRTQPPQNSRPRRPETTNTNIATTSDSNNLDVGTVPTLRYNQGRES